MREYVSVLAIFMEGRRIQARRSIRLVASETLGEPDEATVTRLEGITSIRRLERIVDRAVDASSWQELLATP